jgi:signal transduction histidine kinase
MKRAFNIASAGLLPLITMVTGLMAAKNISLDPSQPLGWAMATVSMTGLILLTTIGVIANIRHAAFHRELMELRENTARQAHDLAESKRSAMLASLAAGIAHELGQPLSAARVGIEGIHYLRQLGREPSAEHVEKTLSRVGMSILSMTQTIEHLRGLVMPLEGSPLSPVDVVTCINAVLAERDQWLRYSDTRIAWEQPAHSIMARGDPAGIRLIVTNLLRNAVEAVAGQGEERRLVRIAIGPGPSIAVHDSGPGIKPEHVRQLFDPFFSTKGGSARGIGLSLARASAQRMGAELSVNSTLGSGTIFTLRLQPA